MNASVMPAWALLALAPKWRGTDILVHSALWPIILGLFYFGCMVASIFFGVGSHPSDPPVDFSTIAGVRNIFATDMGVLIGWSHYLVFDLFVGAWEGRDARRRGFNHLLLLPCLFLTLMFGPVGLLLYLFLRKVTGKGGATLLEGTTA